MDQTAEVERVLRDYWGYDEFRPLQREAVLCGMEARDSLVVLPTGGGKSLCYQVPALCREGLTVVVSPLISLMKDQVDALRNLGVSADFANSSQEANERRQVARRIRSGQTKLLYLAPERLVTESMLSFLAEVRIAMIAVDEAHCISAWGHDFRPEYRRLGVLQEVFPDVSVHAFTATATQQVRHDIIKQLQLRNPTILVGSFDRPNLCYRIQRRTNRLDQITQVLQRHKGEPGIVYCISRNDAETIAKSLQDRGYRAMAYHAGLDDESRQRAQEAFIKDRADTIVATIAFGMGIDKPNVRYVVHAGMPKSLENYQQETGRAGRDGLEAECVLLYSGHDFHVWRTMLEGSEEQPQALPSLEAMYRFCSSVTCRHKSLVEHFGQHLDKDSCGACDVCLDEIKTIDEALVTAQKIISCVARLQQRFGGDYTAQVLTGSKEQRILQRRHDELSTYGLLANHDKRTVRDWIEQLVEQQYLEKQGEYNVLTITSAGREVLRGEITPRLLRPQRRGESSTRSKPTKASWEGVDEGLFRALREIRKSLAEENGIPAYMVFGDQTLREMARVRPSAATNLLRCKGVGQHKLEKFGERFVAEINRYCRQQQISQDVF